MQGLVFRLSPSKIIGPSYLVINQPPHQPVLKFTPPKGKEALTFDLSLTQLAAKKAQAFTLSCSKENDKETGPVALLDLRIKDGRGYLQNYRRVPILGGTGIKYVLRNLALQFLVKNCGIDPANLVSDWHVWDRLNLLGVLRFNYDFGFSSLSGEERKDFTRKMVKNRALLQSATIKDLETPEKSSAWVLKNIDPENIDRIVMFKPDYNQQKIEYLATSLGDMQVEFDEGRAFPSHTVYVLTPEAAAIMPDYLNLLPASPEW